MAIHAGTPQRFETIQWHPRRGERQFLCAPRRSDRLPGAEWLRQIDHHEDDYPADRKDFWGDSPGWGTYRARPHRFQAAHGLRTGRTASLPAPDGAGIPGNGGAVARTPGKAD